jgi:hypothetical protein
MEKAKIKAWFLIFRPWSFTATAIPFLVALALARIFLGWIKFDVDFAVLFEELVNYCTRTGDRNSETCEK